MPIPVRGTRSPLLLVLAYVGFVSLGLPDGLLGVATPSIRRDYGLAAQDIGALLVAYTAGYLASSSVSGWVLTRTGVGTLLSLSCLATAASLLGYAASPWWSLMVAWGTLSGLGAGAIDAGLNAWVAERHSARIVNWLHGFYGVGASGGPLVMTLVLALGWSWRSGYAVVGASQLALAVCFAATRRSWRDGEPGHAAPAATGHGGASRRWATLGETMRRPALWLGVALFLVYTGLEASAGVWAYTMLTQAREVPATEAGVWVSLFWLGLTAGRFAFGWLVAHAPLLLLLRASLGAIVLGTLPLAIDLGPLATLGGLVVSGLAMAPLFPSFIATTPARLGAGHTANAVGLQVSAATLGAALGPTLVGFVVGRLGAGAVGTALLAGALVLFALHEGAARAGRGQPIG